MRRTILFIISWSYPVTKAYRTEHSRGNCGVRTDGLHTEYQRLASNIRHSLAATERLSHRSLKEPTSQGAQQVWRLCPLFFQGALRWLAALSVQWVLKVVVPGTGPAGAPFGRLWRAAARSAAQHSRTAWRKLVVTSYRGQRRARLRDHYSGPSRAAAAAAIGGNPSHRPAGTLHTPPCSTPRRARLARRLRPQPQP